MVLNIAQEQEGEGWVKYGCGGMKMEYGCGGILWWVEYWVEYCGGVKMSGWNTGWGEDVWVEYCGGVKKSGWNAVVG